MRFHCEVGFVNIVPVLVSNCSDEWFYGMSEGKKGTKSWSFWRLYLIVMILLLWSGQAVQQDKLQLSIVELGLLDWHTGDRELTRTIREMWLCAGFVWQGFSGGT